MKGLGLLLQVVGLATLLVVGAQAVPGEILKAHHQADGHTTSAPAIVKATTGAARVEHLKSTAAPAPLKTVAGGDANKAAGVAHHEAVKAVPSVAPHENVAKPKSLDGTAAPAMAPAQRVGQYFEPVCGHLERLQPQQMFKIQSQLKQFVEKTAGKMSLCFMQQYSMDPNLAPVNKQQLETICGSRNMEKPVKGSFKAFAECAANHWEPALDAELARINQSRANSGTKHEHSKNDTLAGLTHDDDELSLMNEVVHKVMADSKVTVAPAAPAAGDKPQLKAAAAVTTHAPSASKDKDSYMEDSNQVLMVVEEGKQTTAAPLPSKAKHVVVAATHTTLAPKTALPGPVTTKEPVKFVAVSTRAPEKVVVVGGADAATTLKPTMASKVIATVTTPAAAHTTSGPAVKVTEEIVIVTTTAKPAGSLGEKIVSAAGAKTTALPVVSHSTVVPSVKPAPSGVVVKTTKAPISAESKPTTKVTAVMGANKKAEVASTAAPAGPTAAPAAPEAASTEKPLKKLENVLEKEEKEKQALDSKQRDERKKVLKEVEKKVEKKDEEAKEAVKALKEQRAQAHGSPADVRMHQIEHERQMAIDPVGHTIKHQEYEMNKKKKAAAATTSASTKAPASSSKKTQ